MKRTGYDATLRTAILSTGTSCVLVRAPDRVAAPAAGLSAALRRLRDLAHAPGEERAVPHHLAVGERELAADA